MSKKNKKNFYLLNIDELDWTEMPIKTTNRCLYKIVCKKYKKSFYNPCVKSFVYKRNKEDKIIKSVGSTYAYYDSTFENFLNNPTIILLHYELSDQEIDKICRLLAKYLKVEDKIC